MRSRLRRDVYKRQLKHNALLRAQYKHWRSVQTGVPELLSVEDKRLLGI